MIPIPPWQKKQWQQLYAYIRQKRVPQALLFYGARGLGKRLLADRFAAALLCQSPDHEANPCGNCQGCSLLAAGNHPDRLILASDEPGKAIGIPLIRKALEDLQLKPHYDTYRIVLIDPADQLNRAAANAFLKFIEEPTERTVVLLVTDKPAKLPITITSRCQRLAFTPPDISSISAWLAEQGFPHAEELATVAANAPLTALNYARDGTLSLYNDLLAIWVAVGKQRVDPVIIAEKWQQHPLDALLFWLIQWTVNLIKWKFNSKLNRPDLNPLQELAFGLDLKAIYNFYDLLLASRQRLDTPLNKQLMLEEILIRWSELNRSKNQ